MKRSSLQCRSTLRRVAMPPRRTPLRRSTSRLGLRSPSRPGVTPEERRARALVKARSGGMCEIAVRGVCTGRATDWCHRIRQGQGGPWSPENGLHGCRNCHMWTHNHPATSRCKGWALKSYDPLDTPVIRRGDWVRLGDDGSVSPAWPEPMVMVSP